MSTQASQAPRSNNGENDTIPVIYHHCISVYDKMFESAKKVRSEGIDMIVYEGHLTKLFKDLRLSVPYYSTVTVELKRMGCIRQLRRGGGNAESQWELIKAPTQQLFLESKTPKRPKNDRAEQLEQQIRSLTATVGALQGKLDALVMQVNQLSMRIDGWRN